jgi:hypothetical protein
MEILCFVPLLNEHEVVGIEIAAEQPDVSEALVKPGLGNPSKGFDERVGAFRLDNPGYGDGDSLGHVDILSSCLIAWLKARRRGFPLVSLPRM